MIDERLTEEWKTLHENIDRGGERSARLVQPFEKSLDRAIGGPTNILNIQGFVLKWQNFWSDQFRSGRTSSAGPD